MRVVGTVIHTISNNYNFSNRRQYIGDSPGRSPQYRVSRVDDDDYYYHQYRRGTAL